MIENLDNIIRQREAQFGNKMFGEQQPSTNNNKEDESVEILKLIFEYIKQSNAKINEKLDKINKEQILINKSSKKRIINKKFKRKIRKK